MAVQETLPEGSRQLVLSGRQRRAGETGSSSAQGKTQPRSPGGRVDRPAR